LNKILADFLVLTSSGLYCSYGDFYIDPKVPVGRALISHAHADHACPGNQYVYCTPETQAIMRIRYGNNASGVFAPKVFYQEFFIKNVQVELFSAGHILGSAQILMTYNGIRYLYTGDYKMQEDATCEPIDYVKADVLITESTFAKPDIMHPDFVDEIKKLNNISFNILLGAYALGKAQRINHLINTFCPQKVVLLHHSILPIHKIYEQFGIDNLLYKPYDRKIMKKHGTQEFVYIVPPLTFNSSFGRVDMIRVFASGWEYLQRNNNTSLYISDHVDWNDILKYIGLVEPQEIWTVHGDGQNLQEHYKDTIPVKRLG
jgi:putative mRNA 3-end processing factor